MAPEGQPAERFTPGTWARLLDLRTYIASLFAIFGVVLLVLGLTASSEEIAKADGININLWTGLGMLALSLVFGLWLLFAPPEVPMPHEESDDDLPYQLRDT